MIWKEKDLRGDDTFRGSESDSGYSWRKVCLEGRRDKLWLMGPYAGFGSCVSVTDFSQNSSKFFKIRTNYKCDQQVFPFNRAERTSWNSRKITSQRDLSLIKSGSEEFHENLICFSSEGFVWLVEISVVLNYYYYYCSKNLDNGKERKHSQRINRTCELLEAFAGQKLFFLNSPESLYGTFPMALLTWKAKQTKPGQQTFSCRDASLPPQNDKVFIFSNAEPSKKATINN